MWRGWRFGLPTSDQVTVINTVVGLAAYVLVAVGSFVALLAYLAATGKPDLEVVIDFRFSFPNEPVFVAGENAGLGSDWIKLKPFRQNEATVRIDNNSSYAARNPGVRIELRGLGGLHTPSGWVAVAHANQVGITVIQWDGGADFLIHGRWPRMLPMLNFDGVFAFGSTSELVVTVAADGFGPRTRNLPVRLLNESDYATYTEKRAARIMASMSDGGDGDGSSAGRSQSVGRGLRRARRALSRLLARLRREAPLPSPRAPQSRRE